MDVSENLAKRLLDAAPDPTVIADRNGTIRRPEIVPSSTGGGRGRAVIAELSLLHPETANIMMIVVTVPELKKLRRQHRFRRMD